VWYERKNEISKKKGNSKMMETFQVKTSAKTDFTDITQTVQEAVQKSV